MEKGLAELAGIPRVAGLFICDNRGDVIVSSTPPVLATVAMTAMGRQVGRIFAALESAARPATWMDFSFGTWRLLAADIDHAILCVVCQPGVDMSLLRMSVDVVVAGWRTNAAVQKRLQRHRVERRGLVVRSVPEPRGRDFWAPAEGLGQ